MPELPVDLWLKPEDVKPEAVLIFSDAGKEGEIPGEGDKSPTPTFEIGVKFKDGSERIWTMNKTSQRTVAQTYGTNTDKWVGKPVTVYTSEQNVRGTLKDVIYARVPA